MVCSRTHHVHPRALGPSECSTFLFVEYENVPRLTSEISSSHRVISWLIPVFGVSKSAVGAALAADTPPASDSDNPAAPEGWGKFALRRFLSVRHVPVSVNFTISAVKMSQARSAIL